MRPTILFILLLLSFAQTLHSESLDTGTWISEPYLTQLGFVQTSLEFYGDNTYMRKDDMKSFCGISAIDPDCIYFWMIAEGVYRTNGNQIYLKPIYTKSVTLQKGSNEEKTRKDQIDLRYQKEEFSEFKIQGNDLVLKDSHGNLHSYKKTSQDGN